MRPQPPLMSHHLVETIDLCFSYPDSPPALNRVSLRITHGESVAVVGGNGAGKSTLLLHLNGLLEPSSGQVRVGDIPVTPKTVARVRESVGMVFQQGRTTSFSCLPSGRTWPSARSTWASLRKKSAAACGRLCGTSMRKPWRTR